MTTDTTDVDMQERRQKMISWGVSLTVNAVLILVVALYARSSFQFDAEEEARRTAEVREREQARAEYEKQKRAEMKVDEEVAEQLTERERRLARRDMIERVEQMRRDHDKMAEMRDEALNRLKRRDVEKLAREMLEPIKQEVEQARLEVEKRIDAVDEEDARDLQRRFDEMAESLEKGMENSEEYEKTNDNLHGRLRELARESRDLIDPIPDGEDKNELRREVQWRMDRAARMARQMPEQIDEETFNDTSTAHTPEADTSTDLAEAEPAEIYQEAQTLENDVTQMRHDVRAAELAISERQSFADARETVTRAVSEQQRPDLAKALAADPANAIAQQAQEGQQGEQAQGQEVEQGQQAQQGQGGQQGQQGQASFADVRAFRETLGQARSQVQRMEANVGQAVGRSGQALQGATLSQYAMAVLRMGQQGQGNSSSSSGDSSGSYREDTSDEGANMRADDSSQHRRSLSEHQVRANALPGRVFDDSAARRGWVYLSTWYVIGPWENNGRVDYENTHPPEFEIDLDATYLNGKFADNPDHPDHELRWEFMQSNRINCEPPRVYGASTYYAYTEVWSDTRREVQLAIASDDAARVWINDEKVFQDNGQSAWRMNEAFEVVTLEPGVNTVLVRIENGPTHCVWSVLLCPTEDG